MRDGRARRAWGGRVRAWDGSHITAGVKAAVDKGGSQAEIVQKVNQLRSDPSEGAPEGSRGETHVLRWRLRAGGWRLRGGEGWRVETLGWWRVEGVGDGWDGGFG